jgi:hypothetical protein
MLSPQFGKERVVDLEALSVAVAVALSGSLAGCAFNYVAEDGSRHAIGLMHLVLPSETEPARASSVTMQAVGLSVTQGDVGTALTVGYSETSFAYVRENTCVHWPLVRSQAVREGRLP